MNEKELQLPYDRCVKIDQEIDTLLAEEKKKQQLNERKAKLMDDSKKSRHFAIYKWLGWNLTLEYMSGQILGLLFFIPLLLLALLTDELCLKVIDIISPSIADLIKIKMSNKKYMIPTNVVDCPITTKQGLYSLLDEKNKYYLRLKDGNLFLYNKDFDYELQVTGTVKNDETQYLINQLEEGKFYSITDIITDNQVKYARGN